MSCSVLDVLGAIIVSFSSIMVPFHTPSHEKVIESMPQSSVIRYSNTITYIKAPTPWSKTLNN